MSHPGYKGLWAAMEGAEPREREREKTQPCASHKSLNNGSLLVTPPAFIILFVRDSSDSRCDTRDARTETSRSEFRRRIVFSSASTGGKRERLFKLSHFPV